jgi:pimeloyl-ACP methyl ester carboxylesterase
LKDKPPPDAHIASVHLTTFPAVPKTSQKTPLLFVHGGSHTGACYIETPDGRAGWAPYAAAHGRTSYVIDWPGHGASPSPVPFHEMSMQHVADEIVELLADVGPAILITHSMGGVVGWRVAELARANVKAIVGIAPGPPANLQPPLDADEIARVRQTDDARFAELGRPAVAPLGAPMPAMRETALAMWANSASFPTDALEAYISGLVPESPRALNERGNINGSGVHVAGPDALTGIPILILTGDQDPRHPRVTDEGIADFFGAEYIWLADRGVTGHGHMMMIEHGHEPIADIFLDWLDARGL